MLNYSPDNCGAYFDRINQPIRKTEIWLPCTDCKFRMPYIVLFAAR